MSKKQTWRDRYEEFHQARTQWPHWMKEWRRDNPIDLAADQGDALNETAPAPQTPSSVPSLDDTVTSAS